MEFTPFTLVAGRNASGKSNLFDALTLLGRLAESDNLKKALLLQERGELTELFTQYGEGDYATQMYFAVEMLVDKTVKDDWGNTATLTYTRLRYELKIKRLTNAVGMEDLVLFHEHLENLKHKEDPWIKRVPAKYREHWRPKVKSRRSTPYIETRSENGIETVVVDEGGGKQRRFPLTQAKRTVLSSFDTVDFPHVLAAKEEMRSWRFLQLNPTALRQPTDKRTGETTLTPSGTNLAATLFRIQQEDAYSMIAVSRKLNQFLPEFIEVEVLDDEANQQYLVRLKDKDQKSYSSRVLSEGTLRILALCILEQDHEHTGLLCFEEPENGLHPSRIPVMADLLNDLSTDFKKTDMPLRQVIVNTHSPGLLGAVHERAKETPDLSVWFFNVRTTVTDKTGKRRALQTTKVTPVDAQANQLSLGYSEEERRLSLHEVSEYLKAPAL